MKKIAIGMAYIAGMLVALFASLHFFIFPLLVLDTGKSLKSLSYSQSSDPYQYQANYYKCIERIMLNENYEPAIYDCPAGYATIGFGHKIKVSDHFTMKLSFKEAYALLLYDFNESIYYAKRLGFVRKDNRQLAIAHCIYCLGVGTTKKILRGGFTKTVLAYTNYKSEDKWIHSKGAYENRMFELKLYRKR